jgi:hypothetical protein
MALEGNQYGKTFPSKDYIAFLKDRENKLMDTQRKFDTTMSNALEIQRRQIVLLDETAEAVTKLYDLTTLMKPKGKTYPFTIVLPAGPTARLVHLDFLTGTKNSDNIPATSLVRFPHASMYSITITNDGPDGIFFDLNEPRSSNLAVVKLAANESTSYSYQFPTFETMNIALEVGATNGATVRIFGLA